MSKIVINYSLSAAAIERIGIETGEIPGINQKLEIDLMSLTPEQRAPIIKAASNGQIKIYKAEPKSYCDGNYWIESDLRLEGFLHSADDVLPLLAQMESDRQYAASVQNDLRNARNAESIANARLFLADETRQNISDYELKGWTDGAAWDVLVELRERCQAAMKVRAHTAAERKVAADAEAKLKREEKHAARLAWAKEHGSAQLRRGLEAGHDCSRLYWIERAALEYVGYTLDYEKNSDWDDRSTPSAAALDERDFILRAHPGVTATIVWLTDEPLETKRDSEDRYNDDEFESCEAVVVDDPDYSRYLIKMI